MALSMIERQCAWHSVVMRVFQNTVLSCCCCSLNNIPGDEEVFDCGQKLVGVQQQCSSDAVQGRTMCAKEL